MEAGFIYIVQLGDQPWVKIGFARDVEERIATLQTANHERLRLRVGYPGTFRDERALHRRFGEYRSEGGGQEWFRLAPEIEEFISQMEGEHSEVQPSLHNEERYQTLRDWLMRWPWDPIDRKRMYGGQVPRRLTASDVHRALFSRDYKPEVVQTMIRALLNGDAEIPVADRSEWPILFLSAYLEVETEPDDIGAIRRLQWLYACWPEEYSILYLKGRRRDPWWTRLMEAIAARAPQEILDAPLFS